jgi:hypothetical protein
LAITYLPSFFMVSGIAGGGIAYSSSIAFAPLGLVVGAGYLGCVLAAIERLSEGAGGGPIRRQA